MERYPSLFENGDADGFDPFDDEENSPRIDNVHAAVDAAVLTHHGLLGPQKSDGAAGGAHEPQHNRHVRAPANYPNQGADQYSGVFESREFSENVEKKLRGMLKRLNRLEEKDDELYWRATTLLARVALIAADHQVSQRIAPECPDPDALFANTARGAPGVPSRLNQTLDYHLDQVGKQAQEWVYRIDHLDLPGLHRETREQLQMRSGSGRFQWQDEAVDHLDRQRGHEGPWLVLNNAETGAGKTRANLRAIEAMTPEGCPMRASIALNLRSLTLQTHDALQNQLGLGDDELVCLVGDSFARAAFNEAQEARYDNDEDEDETEQGEFQVVGEPNAPDLPEWLEHWAPGPAGTRTRTLLGSPLLVSTIDYLIQCGEPGRQGHHVKAFLRIAQSDLVLDEIDSYEPKALVAVLRLVVMSAMMGRRIVASSATLSSPVANALVTAFNVGARMYAALHEQPAGATPGRVSVMDNRLPPESKPLESLEGVTQWYERRVNEMMRSVLEDEPRRRAFIQEVDEGEDDVDARFHAAVEAAARALHRNQRWQHRSGTWVSFGLVRVANVPPCVALAKALNDRLDIHASAYHSMDVKARRAMKEARMDRLFQRSGPDDPLALDPEIEAMIEASGEDELIFVVVATPVEEIGRDHDFDWGVIEPSSTQSIVQTAGRVNRHRRTSVKAANVAILDRNRRSLLHGEGEDCFVMPGNGYAYTDAERGEHRMSRLLAQAPGWSTDGLLDLTAAVHFGLEGQKARFAEMDDAAVERALRGGMDVIQGEDAMNMAWMVMAHYRDYPLRDEGGTVTFEFAEDDGRFEVYRVSRDHEDQLLDDSGFQIREGNRSWLSWSLPEAKAYAEKIGMPRLGMQVEVSDTIANGRTAIRFDEWEGGR